MAKFFSNVMAFHFQGYDAGTHTTRLTVTMQVNPLDATVFLESAERVLPGVRGDALEWAGFYEDGTGSAGTSLVGASTLLGTGTLYVTVYIGTGTGSVAFSGTTLYLAKKDSAEMGGLVRTEAIWGLDGTWAKGKTDTYKLGLSSSGSSGVIDNGASSTAGGYWFIHQHSGSGSLAFQHGTDTITWVDVQTFTNFSGPAGTYRSLGTGTIQRYTRVIAAAGFTGTLSSMHVRL